VSNEEQHASGRPGCIDPVSEPRWHWEARYRAGDGDRVRDESETPEARPAGALPVAIADQDPVASLLRGRQPAFFLDYDGTLTPIVDRPEAARLSTAMRDTLIRLAGRYPVAILSGRDLADLRAMVGIDGIAYAGSHGFDILTPEGRRFQQGTEFLNLLDTAGRELGDGVAEIPGAWVERKRFAVAVHFRQVDPGAIPAVDRVVGDVAAHHPQLRRTGGKKVFELRPDIDWNKGSAVRLLLDDLDLDHPHVALMDIGDDETDEDAFWAVRDRGLGIVVAEEQSDRPTLALLRLPDPEGVRRFLDALATHPSQGP